MEDMTVRETCLIEVKKMSQIYQWELHDENIFAFFVLINFQLSAKHFSVLRGGFRVQKKVVINFCKIDTIYIKVIALIFVVNVVVIIIIANVAILF